MSSIFPIRSSTSLSTPEGVQVVALDEELAGHIVKALNSQTARDILSQVHTEPCPSSDLAETTDTSLQTIRYHLDRLIEADLVEVVDTWYSETGNEMQVYAPTSAALVLFAGIDTTTSEFESAFKQFLGSVGILAVGSILTQWAAQAFRPARNNVAGGGAGRGATFGQSIIDQLPPGVLFFAGGLLLLIMFVGWWLYRTSRL